MDKKEKEGLLELNMNDKITFPDLPVSFDCLPDEFAELVEIRRCGNMDAFLIDVIYKGKPLSIYLSGIAVKAKLDQLMGK